MPTIPDIRTSVENKNNLVLDSHPRNGVFRTDSRNRLVAYAGGFTVVFPYVSSNGEKWALRCWHADIANLKRHFEVLSDELHKLRLPYFCDFIYTEKGINVNGKIYPITRMRWIDGDNLKVFLCNHKNEKERLKKLASNFLKMVQCLHQHNIAHGDLQHGNVLVDKSDKLFLIDYDSAYVPALIGQKDFISGLKGYQHPNRERNINASEKLDFFSELIIYISILAIANNPSLADKYNLEKTEHLLFSREDFSNLEYSSIYQDLKALKGKFPKLLQILKDYLKKSDINELTPFDQILSSPNGALLIPFTDGQTNIEKNKPTRRRTTLERLKDKYSTPEYKNYLRYHLDDLNAADKGDSVAQYSTADWFLHRTNPNPAYFEVAVFWLKKAAKKNHAKAQLKLASCYEEGVGVAKDLSEAKKWYKKAFDNGESKAIRGYTRLKYNQWIYKTIVSTKLQLLIDADNGDPKSQFLLGEWFAGQGLPPQIVESYIWYEKAADKGYVSAMYKMGVYYESRSDFSIAFNWFEKAARLGDSSSAIKIAQNYLYGHHVSKNVKKAIKWFEEGCIIINPFDLYQIGLAYENGDGVEFSYSKAFQYFKKSADQGLAEAQYKVGYCYEKGLGMLFSDIENALIWYKKSADQGYVAAVESVRRINYKIEEQRINERLEKERKYNICYIVTTAWSLGLLVLILIFYNRVPDNHWLRHKVLNNDLTFYLWMISSVICWYIIKAIVKLRED